MVFTLPEWGGAMVHSDPQMTDNIDLPIPTDNVDIIWNKKELNGERAGSKGNGIVGNGTIAACTFSGIYDNLIVYDYEGTRLWTSKGMLNAIATASSPLISKDNKIIACDNKTIFMLKVQNDDCWIEWITDIPKTRSGLLIPFSPTIVDTSTVLLPTKNGPVYAFDADDGRLLTTKQLGQTSKDDKTYFSTINSACVNKNRVYISTQSSNQTDVQKSRVYALDVDRKTSNEHELLTEAWYYPFNGVNQASPLFIKDTVYFDGYAVGWRILKNPKIYAITDKGNRYNTVSGNYSNRTLFSFSRDPRGGFWYEDTKDSMLVHFMKQNGEIVVKEKIPINSVIPNFLRTYRPLSCMTICNLNHPIMLISAITLFFKKYVVAIDLEKVTENYHNNDHGINSDDIVLWQVITDDIGINYSGGQYTILKKNHDSSQNRILYGAYWGGVIALGTKE